MIIIGGDIDIKNNVVGGEVVTETKVLDGDISMSASPLYTGSYEFTPSSETQTILIKGLTAKQDIIINPVPSNYGLITWDGSVLTVS